MNDIEKEIEKDFEEEKESERKEDNIKRINQINNVQDKKKKIIIICMIILILALVGVIIYLIFNSKDKEVISENKDNPRDSNTTIEEEQERLGYVSCDENTSLLNVRNSTTGEIIDGLSCYQKVTIEEELSETENCSKWYKISYQKHGSNYTGYACSTYIKDQTIDNNTEEEVRNLLDRALDYNQQSTSKVFCGNTSESKKIEFTTEAGQLEGEYLKSEFKSLDDLKEYLTSFMDESLIKELKLADNNNPKYYDNYYEIDGNLYCRNYSNSGITNTYTGNYNIEIIGSTKDEITANIAYEYIKDLEKCTVSNISECPNTNFEYNLGKVIIKKSGDNFIINELDFPN